eukprot:gene3855-41543_t
MSSSGWRLDPEVHYARSKLPPLARAAVDAQQHVDPIPPACEAILSLFVWLFTNHRGLAPRPGKMQWVYVFVLRRDTCNGNPRDQYAPYKVYTGAGETAQRCAGEEALLRSERIAEGAPIAGCLRYWHNDGWRLARHGVWSFPAGWDGMEDFVTLLLMLRYSPSHVRGGSFATADTNPSVFVALFVVLRHVWQHCFRCGAPSAAGGDGARPHVAATCDWSHLDGAHPHASEVLGERGPVLRCAYADEWGETPPARKMLQLRRGVVLGLPEPGGRVPLQLPRGAAAAAAAPAAAAEDDGGTR